MDARVEAEYKRALKRDKEGIKVFYGVGRVSKLRRKRTVEFWYANSQTRERQQRVLNASIHIAYERKQTEEEKEAAYSENRVFTAWWYDIDAKPFNGSLEAALKHNTRVCANHVSKEEGKGIEAALRAKFYEIHKGYKEPKSQLELWER